MSKGKVNDWAQVFTGLALILGLILVIAQMYENRAIATIQIIQEYNAEHFAFQRQIMGENPAATLVKACFEPDELTETEMTVVMAWIDYRYDSIMMHKTTGEVTGDESVWRARAEYNLKVIFSTKLGRVEYEAHKNDQVRWDPEIAEIANDILEKQSYQNCKEKYKNWKNGLGA